ncbi:Tyrosine--tRNA ligase [Trichinella pseudospiralis]
MLSNCGNGAKKIKISSLCNVRGYNAKNRNVVEVAEKPALTVTLKWSMEIHLSYLFTQCELNDLVRDLGFPKVGAEILGSRLQSKHMLAPGITVWMYRKRETEFTPFFRERRLSCVF